MLHAFTTTVAAESVDPLIPAIPDLVWGTIAFFIVLAFFAWKILPNVNKALDARRDAIEGGIQRAEQAQAEANAVLENYTDQLAEARAEAARIREQARDEGKRIIADLRDQASSEAARIQTAAQAQIEADRKAAAEQLRTEVGSLAIDLASGVIGESLKDDKKASDVVDRFLAELEASENGAAEAKS